MMKKLLLTTILSLFSFFFLAGCLSDDVEDTVDIIEKIDDIEGTPGSLVAEINGEVLASSGSFTSANKDEGQNGSFNLTIAGVRIKDGLASGIVAAIWGTDFSSLSAGDTFVGSDTERLFVGGYAVNEVGGDEDNIVSAGTELVASATCTITKIDRVNELISGTFSFNAIDDDTGLVYEVRKGVFTDLEY